MEQLYIPVNIRKRKEVIEGIGKEEIVKIVIAFFIGVLIGIVIFIAVFPNIMSIMTPAILIAGTTTLFVKRDSMNRSSIDRFRNYIDYSKTQKRYFYKYYNVYEKGGEKKV